MRARSHKQYLKILTEENAKIWGQKSTLEKNEKTEMYIGLRVLTPQSFIFLQSV